MRSPAQREEVWLRVVDLRTVTADWSASVVEEVGSQPALAAGTGQSWGKTKALCVRVVAAPKLLILGFGLAARQGKPRWR